MCMCIEKGYLHMPTPIVPRWLSLFLIKLYCSYYPPLKMVGISCIEKNDIDTYEETRVIQR